MELIAVLFLYFLITSNISSCCAKATSWPMPRVTFARSESEVYAMQKVGLNAKFALAAKSLSRYKGGENEIEEVWPYLKPKPS